jgi:hypothetical protein
MKLPACRRRQAIAVLLVIAAGLLVIGVTTEGVQGTATAARTEEPATL